MATPQGAMWGRFVYREISEPEKLVYVTSFADENGDLARAPFSDLFPLEQLNTLTFEEQDGRTTLILRSVPINATDDEIAFFAGMHDSMHGGWAGTLDQLEAHLSQQ
jgi:uncharacterized protein YndB with AHSA1/START domain